MNHIRIIPTFLRMQVNEKTHKLMGVKMQEDRIEMKLKSYFNISGLAKGVKAELYKNILAGEQVGNMILPYIGSKPAGTWSYGSTFCHLGSMHTTDRVLVFEKAREVAEADMAGEALFAEADTKKKLLTIYRSREAYDNLAPGSTGLKLLIHNFYENRDVLFECHIDRVPVPGIDEGNYVFTDGSMTELFLAKGDVAPYDWGNILVKGKRVEAAVGSGISPEWSAEAEKEGCLHALTDNLCGWTKEDEITIFFDSVNNAYPILGWYAKTDYAEQMIELAKKYKRVTFYHIDGHVGVLGNELADSIANINLRAVYFSGLNRDGGLRVDKRHVQQS